MYQRLSASGANLPLASVQEGDESRSGAQSPPLALPPRSRGGGGGDGGGNVVPLRSVSLQKLAQRT